MKITTHNFARLTLFLLSLSIFLNPKQLHATVSCGGFKTYTQGGWGTSASGNNPGTYRDANFSNAFPSGLTVGCSTGFTITFTTSAAVKNFLPAGGSASKFTRSATNPTSSSAGVLGGQLVALSLSVRFDEYDPNFASSNSLLKNQIINIPSSPFNGMTVSQFLNLANQFIGGCASSYTASQFNTVATLLNENYDNGCVDNGNLSCPATPPTLSLTVIGNNLCFGGSSGAINSTVSGGTPPYTYLWSNSATSQNISGLPNGTYTLTVTDAASKTATSSASITSPSEIIVTISSQTNLSCFGANSGSVTLSVSGGTSPYTYSKDGINYQSSATFSSLASGSYSFRVKDANGCVKTYNVSITQPSQLIASVSSVVNVKCFGSDKGAVTLAASGGTSPYSYSKDGNTFQSSPTFASLNAGNYSFTVKDNNGCTTTVSATVTQPAAALAGSVSAQANVSCFGGSNASITLAASGGTSPYSYSKDGSTFQSSATFASLNAGNYSFTVKDNNGCTTTVSATVTQPSAALAGSVSAQANVSCFGGSNASITLAASGGTSPYSYSKDGNTFQSSATFASLNAGNYSFVVKDSKGCTFTIPVQITQPNKLIASITGINANCIVNNVGVLLASATGGTGAYSYSWNTSPVATTDTIKNLWPGTYTVTVKDGNNCTATQTATVTTPPNTFAYLSNFSQTSQQLSTNVFNFVALGTTLFETYMWDFGDGTFSTLSNPTKTYTTFGIFNVSLTATNLSGCTRTTYMTVVVLPGTKSMDSIPACKTTSPVITYKAVFQRDYTDWSGTNLKTRKIPQFDTTLGTLVGLRVISSGDFVTQNKVEITGNMPAGTFRLAKIQTSGSMLCGGPGLLYGLPNVQIADSFYSTGFDGNIDFAGTSGRDFGSHYASTLDSTIISNNSILNMYSGNDSVTFTAYTFTQTDAAFPTGNSVSIIRTLASDTITVSYFYCPAVRCNLFTSTTTSTQPTCRQSDGKIQLTLNGGAAPYNITWSNGNTSILNNNIPEGTYTYTVVDDNGCRTTGTATLSTPSLLISSVKSGDWNNPTVWDAGRVPTLCDDVHIRNNDSVTVLSGFPKAGCRDLQVDGNAKFYIYDTLNCRDFKTDNPGSITKVYGQLNVCSMFLDNLSRVYACKNINISNCTYKNKPLDIVNGATLNPLGGTYCNSVDIDFKVDSGNVDLRGLCGSNIGIQTLIITNATVTLDSCNAIVDYIRLNQGADCNGRTPKWTGMSKLAINRDYNFDTSSILWVDGSVNTPKNLDVLCCNVNVNTPKHVVNRVQLLGGNLNGGTNLIMDNNSYLFRCGGILTSPAQMGTNVTVEMCSDTNNNNPPAIIGTTDMPPGGFTGDLIISTNVVLGGDVTVPVGRVIVTSTGTLNDSNFVVSTANAVNVQDGGTIITSKPGGLTGANSLLGNLPTTLAPNSTTIYAADTTATNQVVSNNVTYGNLILTGSSTKAITGTTNVQGDFTITDSSGTVTAAVGSTVVFNGNDSQNLSGINFYNVTFDSSGTKTLTSPATTQGLITISQNAVLNTNDQLTVLSNPSGTSGIGPLVNGADIVGNICWERYIPGGSSRRRWRFLSMPIWGQNFRNAWQDEIFITGPGTGGIPCPTMQINSNGFDQNNTGLTRPLDTAFYSTIFTWDERFNRWRVLPSTYDSIDPLIAYRTFVRGDRKIEGCSLLVQMPDSVSAVTIRSCGPPVKFTQVKTVTVTPTGANGWNYVTNPYPCSIDWNNPAFAASRGSAINSTIYIYNPSTNSYASWNPIAGGTNGGSNIVGTAQSLFIQAYIPTNIVWEETYKTYLPTSGLFGKTASNPNQMNIKLVNPEFSDEAVFFFYKGVSKGFDKDIDAIKVGYGTNGIATGTSVLNDKLVYNAIPATTSVDTILMYTGLSATSTNYSLAFVGISSFNSKYTILLRDKYKNLIVNLRNNDKYSFSTITGNSASSSQSRFELIIIDASTLPVSLIDFRGEKQKDGTNKLLWSTASEINNSHFVTEHSTNGVDFTEFGNVKGNGTTLSLNSYTATHGNPAKGINYYRLKQVDMNGDFHYTYTIALDDDITNEPVSVSVFPVPATDVLNINISGMQHTDVTHAQVFDITGKLVLEKSSSLQIDISNLSKGTFFITIKLSDGSVHNLKFIKI